VSPGTRRGPYYSERSRAESIIDANAPPETREIKKSLRRVRKFAGANRRGLDGKLQGDPIVGAPRGGVDSKDLEKSWFGSIVCVIIAKTILSKKNQKER